MSKNFKKYLLNNLKEATYLRNIDRVEFDSTKTDSNDMLNERDLKRRRDKLDEVQIFMRHNNLHVYVKNMLKFRVNQVLTLAVPIALAAGTVASFVSPYKRVVSKNFTDVYVKESTVLSNTEGQITDIGGKYYYDTSSLSDDYKYVNENDDDYNWNACMDNLTYQISDGVNSALAQFSYSSEGKLSFEGVDIGNYIDVSEYDFSNATDVDEKYEKLFDEVLNLIKEQGDLTDAQRQMLDDLAESPDKKTIINIIRYDNIGAGATDIYKTRFWQRFFLSIASFIYGLLLFAVCKDGDVSKGTQLCAENGNLGTYDNRNIGFWHVALKYKEAFIKAETERIKMANEMAEEYVRDDQVDSLFIEFEKKLLIRR